MRLSPFRAIALLLCLPSLACEGSADGIDTVGERSDTVLLADTSSAPAGSGANAPGPAAADPGLGTPGAVAADASADAPEPVPTSISSDPSPPEPPLGDPQDMDLEERIDLLVRSQLATQARLDSLTFLVSSTTLAVDSVARGLATGEVLGEAGSQVRNFGVGILWSIVVVLVFSYLIRAVTWVLERLAERSAKRRLFFKGLVPIVRIILWTFAGYLIVRVIFRVDAQGIIAGAAALGVAVGFAAQDLLKNLFGGIILVFDQPFQVGDKIRVGETYGEVTSIGLRSTRIVTPDDNLVSVPNAQVVDQQVANANAGELNCQVVIDLYLSGEVDEAEAKRIAFEAAVGSKYVYLNKPIVVLIKDELHWAVLTRVRVKAYVLDPRHEFLFASDVTERARAGFRAAGMTSGSAGPPPMVSANHLAEPSLGEE
jgi:small-conductance mechanosensitive channel